MNPPDACPLCGAPVYVCDAEHSDGKRYAHCRQFPTHNFPLGDPA